MDVLHAHVQRLQPDHILVMFCTSQRLEAEEVNHNNGLGNCSIPLVEEGSRWQ